MDYRKDYYQILEVPVTASKEDIRAAYRRLAKLFHPDINAGDAEAEEKFKLINEANEILSNAILKEEYDSYRKEQERWKQNQTQDKIKQSNKKHYRKTTTVVTETRLYLRGEIAVKYWADCKDQVAASHNTDLHYKINPTEAIITISEQDIFPLKQIPTDYLRAFKESEIFTMPVPQPIRCEVIGESGKEYFELSLNDIRIKNIKLEGITKHENRSYGILRGQFYGYSPKLTSEEVQEEVTECFGETGQVEQKEEDGFRFIRKEYYHPDCSKYWGSWIKLPRPATYKQAAKRSTSFTNTYSYGDPGCGLFTWVITLLALLFLSPEFFIFCLLLTGLGLLLYHGNVIFSSAGSILSFLGTGLLLLLLITAVRSMSGRDNGYIKKNNKISSVKTTRTVRQSSLTGDSTAGSTDTLITHFLKWQDYAGQSYEGNISISAAALRSANTRHRLMSQNFYQDIRDVYQAMLNNDSSDLLYVYETFDSIRAANDLDEVSFSQVLVSAVQSQPYFLVLDKGCDDNYSDDFTRNYLANCNTDCCIGNELFGVLSPIEFLSDLKGDCDTRSLLLYQLLKHYNYNVALLTSNYYKHAMIAVNFTQPLSNVGKALIIGDRKYYMWETTSPHLNYGELPSGINNLSYWNISLLNKK